MWSCIFINYYSAGLYFGTVDSVQKYPPIKVHFDEIICEVNFIIVHITLLQNSP